MKKTAYFKIEQKARGEQYHTVICEELNIHTYGENFCDCMNNAMDNLDYLYNGKVLIHGGSNLEDGDFTGFEVEYEV